MRAGGTDELCKRGAFRVTALVLVLVLAFGLSACGGDATEATDSPTTAEATDSPRTADIAVFIEKDPESYGYGTEISNPRIRRARTAGTTPGSGRTKKKLAGLRRGMGEQVTVYLDRT